MIVSFRCRDTEKLFESGRSKRFANILSVAERKLQALDDAVTLEFLKSPPGNMLEALKGDRAGQHSIRINGQWRLCFVWTEHGPPMSKSVITTDQWTATPKGESAMARSKNGMRAVHPGEILREEYLKPLGLSVNALSKALHVPATRINDIVLERRGVTPDTALRLARYFGGDARSWLNLQVSHDLKVAEKDVGKTIAREVQPRADMVSAADDERCALAA